MFDINNKEIAEGQYLKVIGCKVKNDNGIYIVDRQWDQKESFTLLKVLQNGEKSETKYNIFFLEDRAYKKNPDLQVKIINKDELKQAAQEVKAYINGVTAGEKVYTFIKSEEQETKEGKYIKFVKRVLFSRHSNTIGGVTYYIERVFPDGGVYLHLMGKKGEKIAGNINGYYGFTPINLKISAKSTKQLLDDGSFLIMERQESTKGEQKKEEKKPELKQPIEERKTAIIPDTKEGIQTIQPEPEPEPEPEKQEEQTGQTEEQTTNNIQPVFFSINETAARQSKQMWSMSDYINGSETEAYQKVITEVYSTVNQIAKERPEKLEKALTMAERYSRKYAEWINKGFQIELMCPSVMISGAGNFPVARKEKQNARRDNYWKEYNDYLKNYPQWIKNLLYDRDIIKSSDPNAIEQLKQKLKNLEKEREEIKAHNKKMRAEGTPEKQHASYKLQNLGQNIKTVEQRIKGLERIKQEAEQKANTDNEEYKTSVCRVVENAELMRIQLLFDSIPSAEARTILKSNGFKWSPSNKAWQRQLTDNARYATKQVLKKLEAV